MKVGYNIYKLIFKKVIYMNKDTSIICYLFFGGIILLIIYSILWYIL